MSKQKKITRKQLLKEPDEFITTTGKVIRWGQQYARQLAAAAGVILLLLVVIAGYRYYTDRAENKAFALLDQALNKYETQKASQDVLSAYESVKEDFEYVIRKYDNTDGGKLAMVVLAGLCYDAGDVQKAIELYEGALDGFDSGTPYENLLLSGLGYAYEKKQDIQMALACFEKIAAGSDAVVKDVALFNMGRLYMQLGQTAESRAAYERLTTEFADSLYYELAREEIAG